MLTISKVKKTTSLRKKSNNIISDPSSNPSNNLSQRSFADLQALIQAFSTIAVISETDADGNITYVNDKFLEASKYSREELIGQNHRLLKSGFHPRAFYQNMWAKIGRGELWRGQVKNRAKDGSFYWVDTSIAPILGENKKPIKYISVRFPITERQQAEEELQEKIKQQNVLTTISQKALASDELPSLCDMAVNFLTSTMNVDYAVVEKLLPDGKNLSFEAGVGWSSVDRKKTLISAKMDESVAGFTLSLEEPVVIEDLSIEARFSGSDLLHDHGVISGVSVLIPGQELPFGTLAVFAKVKRAFSLDEINFIQAVANLLANAARNQLDKRKVEFLGIASHELRTPLTSVKTFIQLLQKEEKAQKHGRVLLFLDKIDHQLGRLTDLVNDLLDISRINSGRLEYKDESFEIYKLLKETVKEIQLADKKHKIELLNGSLSKVYGDKFRIQQVIINLLTNAIKYSLNKDKIIVKAETDQSKDGVVISVQDFGIGIAKEEKPHIFDRFFQGNGEKKDQFPGGLGLGLYIAAEIIKRHHGQIWVESEIGKGSIFYFSLPRKH